VSAGVKYWSSCASIALDDQPGKLAKGKSGRRYLASASRSADAVLHIAIRPEAMGISSDVKGILWTLSQKLGIAAKNIATLRNWLQQKFATEVLQEVPPPLRQLFSFQSTHCQYIPHRSNSTMPPAVQLPGGRRGNFEPTRNRGSARSRAGKKNRHAEIVQGGAPSRRPDQATE
jgi:hypothetical protein